MNALKELWRRLVYLTRRKQMDADLAEEMRLHLELREAERVAQGTAPADAPSAARKDFGNVTRLKEKSRDAWGWGWLDSVAQDLRYGWRNLLSARGFTITAILSLALGIGANTAIFSIVNAAMLRTLPVPDPHRLAVLNVGGNEHLTNPLWEAIRDHQNGFSGTFAYGSDGFDLAQEGEKRIVRGLWVSGDFFNVLGVPAYRGRVFNRDDDLHGGGKFGPVAVISYEFWQSHFGGASDVLGKIIRLDNHPFEVIGVTPPHFRGVETERAYNIAIPIGCEPAFHPDGSALKNRSWWWLRVAGRLAPGVSAEQATERMKAVAPGIMQETLPDWDAGGKAQYAKNTISLRTAATGLSRGPQEAKVMLFAMMGIVGMVLLIACANIANLLLARAAARQQEISVRLAIGAGRGRLVRQLLTEAFLLAALGVPGGLLIAVWGSRFLSRTIVPPDANLELDVSMDARVLLFTVGITLLTGLIFGLAPALRATRISTNEVLKQTGRSTGGSRFRLGRALVAGQVALSLALLVAAGLFVTTLRNLLNVSLGFNQRGILVINYDPRGRVPKDQRVDHFTAVEERIRNVPGVVTAGSAMITPISGAGWNGDLAPEMSDLPDGFSPETKRGQTYFNRISPGFFETLQIPIVMGRDFSAHDKLGSQKVIIIGEKTAQSLYGDKNPVGLRVKMGAGPGKEEMYEIVGVVRNSKYIRLREDTRMTAFVPMAQDSNPWEGRTFLIRSASTDFNAVKPSLKSAIAEIAPGSSLEFKSLEHDIRNSISQQRVIAGLVSFFGGLALLLAVVGLYGVTSYAAAQRKSEIGIRMALGAQRSSVIWLVLRDVAIILALGSIAGIGLSFGAGKLIGTLMFGIKPGDPMTLIMAAIVLGIAGAIAGFVPALRASKLDPSVALRYE